MFYRIKLRYWQFRMFVDISRQKGNGLASTILLLLPKLIFSKAYGKIARALNNSNLLFFINAWRLQRFHSRHHHKLGGHFYVIVMPGTLHFLTPCLKLIPPDTVVFLVFNGARAWEKDYLGEAFPQFPRTGLFTLPHSSTSHGVVISLFLKNNNENFGILDHDLYVFDKSVFKKLFFRKNSCMLAVFKGESQSTDFVYPHSCFLFFNTRLLKNIMNRYKVDARIYRKAPSNTTDKLEKIGIGQGVYLKDYHDYFDTLQLMLALCFAEGFDVDYIDFDKNLGIYHVGGTSIGSHITKDLSRSYIALRFLKHVESPVLNKKYAYLLPKAVDSEQIRHLIPNTVENSRMLFVLDQILQRLEAEKSQ